MYGAFLDLKSYNPWLRIRLPLYRFFIHVFLLSFYSNPVTGYMDKTMICKNGPVYISLCTHCWPMMLSKRCSHDRPVIRAKTCSFLALWPLRFQVAIIFCRFSHQNVWSTTWGSLISCGERRELSTAWLKCGSNKWQIAECWNHCQVEINIINNQFPKVWWCALNYLISNKKNKLSHGTKLRINVASICKY